MHVFVAAVAAADDYDPKNVMDGLTDTEFDYYTELEDDTVVDGVNLSEVHNVGDLRRISAEKLVPILHGICVYRKMYGNPFCLYTLDQEKELYDKVLSAYDDDVAVRVFDVHI